MRRSGALVAAFMTLVAACAQARADDLAKARELYHAATQDYDLGEYKEALEGFKQAYRAHEDPTFLFDIAQCLRQLGDKPAAIRAYRTFLIKIPDAPNREQVLDMVAKLEKQVAEEQASKASPPQGTLSPGEKPPTPPTQAVVPPPVEPAPPTPPTASGPGRARTMRLAGIGCMVGGAAALVLGGVFVGLAKAANDDATSSGTYDPDAEGRRDTFEALDATFFTVGALAAAAGVALYVLGRRQPRSYSFSPAVAPGRASIAFTIGF